MQKLNTTQKKQTTQNTAKQYYTWPGNKVGLFYNASNTTPHGSSKACSK